MPAPAPSRSTMKLTITIGMIPIAVDVFSATEDSNVSRSMYVRAGDSLHKVGQKTYDTITGVTLERSDTIKCVELDDGALVEVSDDEIQALLASENGTCNFIGFLDWGTFTDRYSIEGTYQIRAQKAKTKQNPFEKPFALLCAALQRKNVVGLLSYVNRGKTRYAAITADAAMYSLRFDEEIREQRPIPEVTLSEAELGLADQLVEAFTVTDAPVFSDEDSQKVLDFAAEKAKTLAAGGEVVIPTADAPVADAGGDLMALLAASINKGA